MRTLAPMLALALALPACAPVDADGDGVPASLDCDDTNIAIYPGATEVCDGEDNDCNEIADDDYARGGQIFFLDRDGDGFGVWEQAKVRCAAPAGYVDNSLDCSDDDPDVYPGAPEFCDKVDQDCNGEIDDNAVDGVAYYTDYDLDGYGGTDSATYACEQPPGSIVQGGDCDDFSAIINPEATERCDLIDNDCNGIIDDADSLDATIWYGDKDRDGYGDPEDTIQSCSQPEYYQPEELAGDCDDSNADVNPGVNEQCNDGIDNNCNGSADFCIYENWEYGSDAMVTFTGTGSSAYYGADNSIVGDVNGDGIDDFIVAGYRGTGQACSNSGSSYCGDTVLIYGSEDIQGKSFTTADGVSFSPTTTYDYAGVSVAGLGDLDQDGYADFGIGAYSDDYGGSSSGSVYIVYGGPDLGGPGDWHDLNAHAQFFEEASFQYLGYAMGSGDVNGDGYGDALFASPDSDNGPSNDLGAVYVYYGSRTRAAFGSARNLPTLHGAQAYEDFGGNTSNSLGTGDFNGDGIDDALIGARYYDAPGISSSGRVYLIYGQAEQLVGRVGAEDAASATYAGSSSSVQLGTSANGVGDVNGDGYDDMGMCGYGYSSYAGACAFVLGGASPKEGDNLDPMSQDVGAFTATGTGSSSYLGYYGLVGADYDQDGFNEVVVGSYRASDPSGSVSYSGGLMVIPGGEEHLADYTFTAGTTSLFAQNSYDYLGRGVGQEVGDVNGDGFPDLLAGAYGASSYAGQAYIWLGGGL